MCQFLSAVVTAKGDVLTSDVSDSHEDIIQANNLDGDKVVRVEYTSETLTDISTYKLKIDPDEIPDWWNDTIRDKTERKLHNMAKRMILTTGEYQILLGGKWVLGGDVKVKVVKSAYVVTIRDSASIETVWGYTSIETVGDSASIGNAWDSARIITDNRKKA